MIAYCDTSAMVKLYIVETGREQVLELSRQAEAIAISRINWVELHSAFARRVREKPEDSDALEQARSIAIIIIGSISAVVLRRLYINCRRSAENAMEPGINVMGLALSELTLGYNAPDRTINNTFTTTVADVFQYSQLLTGFDDSTQRTHVFADTTSNAVTANDVDFSLAFF